MQVCNFMTFTVLRARNFQYCKLAHIFGWGLGVLYCGFLRWCVDGSNAGTARLTSVNVFVCDSVRLHKDRLVVDRTHRSRRHC